MSYEYRHVQVAHVVDGDTVTLNIDMGSHIWWRENFRLAGIDTPEKNQVGYFKANEYLKGLLELGISRVATHKPDKFGRWLVDIWISTSGGELHVNRVMIVEGYAKEYSGGAKT